MMCEPLLIPKFLQESDVSDSPIVACPVCDQICVHIENVSVNQNGMVATIERVVHVDPGGPKSGRGSRVLIRYWCESGHCFGHQFSFHKGSVEAEVLLFESYDPGEEYRDQLWRD